LNLIPLKKIIRHNTFKNFGYLTIGNIISQVIALIGAFYIPKLLGTEQYGVYNTVVAFVGLFTVFTFSGLIKVIIREATKNTSKTQEILEATIGLRNLFSIFAAILAIIVVLFINYEFGTKIYIAFYSLSLLFTGIGSSVKTVFQSHQKMKILGVMAIVKQLIQVPLSILFLSLGYGILSLIIIHLLIEILVTIILYHYSKNIVTFNFFSKVKIIKDYVLSGARFSLLTFLNVLSLRVDLIMLSFLTTPENVGIYALAYNLINKGLIIRGPIFQSIFPYYSNKYNKKLPQVNDLIKQTLLISIPSIIIVVAALALIKLIIINIIGEEFLASIEIFRVLVFYLIFMYMVIPWGAFLQATNNEKLALYPLIIGVGLNIIGNILLFDHFGIIGIAYSTLIVVMFLTITQIIYCLKILKPKIIINRPG